MDTCGYCGGVLDERGECPADPFRPDDEDGNDAEYALAEEQDE